jgi:Glycosyltransferase family 87
MSADIAPITRHRGHVPLPALAALVAALAVGAWAAAPSARAQTRLSPPHTSSVATVSNAPVSVPTSDTPLPGRRLSSAQVIAIAARLPKMRSLQKSHRHAYPAAYTKGPGRWQVSYFTPAGKEIGQVIIADSTGRVLEQWTGFQVAWTMARGYKGAFGEHVNALYIWIPLCVLFFLPFLDWRRPLSLLHLDLLALLSFSVSLAFFNHADIYASVPLTYPPLVYLLARMLALARGGRRRPARQLRLLVPVSWLAVATLFLVGFRVTLNVTDSNVIDVGYAGVIGADRIVNDRALYGGWPSDNEHGDTYGPVTYESYLPFQQIFGWSGHWDDLPAAHAAAVAFDLLAIGLIFLVGWRIRGPTLGIVLAYAWCAYPFTLFALESNSNDVLVAVLLLAALLAASRPISRGAAAALAGLAKFAPLAVAPLLATHELRARARGKRAPALVLFAAAFLVTAGLVAIPALTHDSLHTIYERTIAYQQDRKAPFSVWGLYGIEGAPETAVEIAAIVLALALAAIPRPPGVPALAATAAGAILAVQLGLDYWFYLYIPWFFAPALVAIVGSLAAPAASAARTPDAAAASGPARLRRPAFALSTK